MWPEINQLVNSPVKKVLVEMEAGGEINMTDAVVKFCVSWTTINVVTSATNTFIAAWNAHRIPNILASHASQSTRLPASRVPTTEEVVRLHQSQGGSVTREHAFGRDPLEVLPQLQDLRKRDFFGGTLAWKKCFKM